jgi:hypothetical protein
MQLSSRLSSCGPAAHRGVAAVPAFSLQQLRDRLHSTTAASTSDRATADAGVALRPQRARSDLFNVNGVGKRNQELLRAAGILSLDDLLRKYALELERDTGRAQAFLRVRGGPRPRSQSGKPNKPTRPTLLRGVHEGGIPAPGLPGAQPGGDGPCQAAMPSSAPPPPARHGRPAAGARAHPQQGALQLHHRLPGQSHPGARRAQPRLQPAPGGRGQHRRRCAGLWGLVAARL